MLPCKSEMLIMKYSTDGMMDMCSQLLLIHHMVNSALWLIRTMASNELDILYWLAMLKSTVNSSYRIIRTNCLYSDGDELSVVDCMYCNRWCQFNCLPEAGDIVTLPMKSISLVVAYSSMLFSKLFHSLALPGAPSIAYHLLVDWHHSKRCVYS